MIQVLPFFRVPLDAQDFYWDQIIQAGLLPFRFHGVKKPDITYVYQYIGKSPKEKRLIYYVVIPTNPLQVVGEIALDTFTGTTAMIHFSALPTRAKPFHIVERMDNAIAALSSVQPGLTKVYGLTPLSPRFRMTRLTAKKLGFKRIGILHDSVVLRAFGETISSDGLITEKDLMR